MLKDIDLSNTFKKSETGKYKYNSNLDINETIEIETELKDVGAKVVYFPYTKGTSSTLINETLVNLRSK